MFSVIIPTYNRGGQTIAAVRSALAQNGVPAGVEVIVVDDGSSDGSMAEIAAAFDGCPQVHVMPNSRAKGPAGARNTGILAAVGSFLALLDSDDIFVDGHLADCLHAFAAHPEVGVIFGRALYERDGRPVDYMGPNFERKLALAPTTASADGVRVFSDGFFTHLLVYGCFFNLSTVALRADAARELMCEELRIAEDYEFWARLARHHRFACLERPQIRYTLHDANISFEADASAAGHAPRQLAASRIMRGYPGLSQAQLRMIDEQMADLLFSWAYRCRLERDFAQSARLHWRSLRLGRRGRNMAALLKLLLYRLSPVASASR